MSTENQTLSGAELIAQERHRQIVEEMHCARHDDTFTGGELAQAAIAYTVAAHDQVIGCQLPDGPPATWPWGEVWWKRSGDPTRNLVKAGALIAAEIDRLQRAVKAPATHKTATTMRHSVRNNKPTRARNRAGEEGR